MSEETAEYRMKNRSDIDTLIEQDRTLKIKQGLEFLESVILDVLREAKHNGEPPLDAGEITCCAVFHSSLSMKPETVKHIIDSLAGCFSFLNTSTMWSVQTEGHGRSPHRGHPEMNIRFAPTPFTISNVTFWDLRNFADLHRWAEVNYRRGSCRYSVV